MIEFGIRNLRRLNCVDLMPIRPITVLVGRNSSGKSSFLRSLPLLRQSIMTRTSSPILWYGDFVDFGSFDDAVGRAKSGEPISFEFKLDDVEFHTGVNRWAYYDYRYAHATIAKDIRILVSVIATENRTRLHSFSISLEENKFEMKIDEDGKFGSLSINGQKTDKFLAEADIYIESGSIFPEIVVEYSGNAPDRELLFGGYSPFNKSMVEVIEPVLHRRIGSRMVGRLAEELLSMGKFNDEQIKVLEHRSTTKSFSKLLSDLRGPDKNKIRNNVKTIIELNQFFGLANSVFRKMKEIISGIRYIGPARARSERYYRYQELAVSEIDSDGKNFPMFLNSLTGRQRESFSKWVRERFGYGVNVSQLEGHISIHLDDGTIKSNIVDTGFGVSQVLPVLGQIWWAIEGPIARGLRLRQSSTSILAIEQPELHLHPAHQALLADAIALQGGGASGKEERSDLHFILETHSEALINRLGELISLGRVAPEKIQILIFENSYDDKNATVVRQARFGADGSLINWPYGFFVPEPAR